MRDSIRKCRLIPGAIFRAIIAASIASVPEPQNGSRRGVLYFQETKAISAAARFSFIGASHASSRYPRLWSGSPVTSMSIRAISSTTSMSMCISTQLVVFGVRRVSKIAFWETLWSVGMLASTDRVDDASITILSFPVRYALQSIVEQSEKSSSKSVIFDCASSR